MRYSTSEASENQHYFCITGLGVVRVAGYSDYFTKLSPKMQEEVIARTEHEI